MRDAVSTGAFLSAVLTVGSELLADAASAPAPPPVFDAGVALAPVLVLLDVAVEELLLGAVLDELLETSLLDELVPVSVLESDALVVVFTAAEAKRDNRDVCVDKTLSPWYNEYIAVRRRSPCRRRAKLCPEPRTLRVGRPI